MIEHCILPDWPAPPQVRTLQTTRNGGESLPPYHTLNLGDHVGDDVLRVARNRAKLSALLPGEPAWLKQEHGIVVVDAGTVAGVPCADASIARRAGAVCVVMTADCLPVLLCDDAGTVVGAAHAGWRGLCDGVIEATVQAMAVPPSTLMAWLGPAIGAPAFEVGDEVRSAFVARDAEARGAFVANDRGKWQADIYRLARLRLARLGVRAVYGGDACTYRDESRFFSYRRDGATGRMGSFIWLSE